MPENTNIKYNYKTCQWIRCQTQQLTHSFIWSLKKIIKGLSGVLPEAGSCKRNENPAPTPVRACSVEPVKMCFVLRGSHCPHKHTHTGFFFPGLWWQCVFSLWEGLWIEPGGELVLNSSRVFCLIFTKYISQT